MADVAQHRDQLASTELPDAAPVPLSFPALLRNPKLSDRFAHLHISTQPLPQPRPHKTKKERTEPEGKRWVRRRENATFTHNPHIALPTSADVVHPLQVSSSTFPHPLPAYLPRTLFVPPSRPPPTSSSSSSAGLFSLSLRGVRRTLRARPSSAHLVEAIESHLVAWLQGGTYLNPDQVKSLVHFPGDPVGGRDDIREVGREAGRLVWAVRADPIFGPPGHQDGGFARFVVHCVARWYGVVSFSKETDGYRLTYLLRPNITRPDPRINVASRVLDTPPTTDISDFHVSDASLSDLNMVDTSDDSGTAISDIDSISGDLPANIRPLSDIEESRPSSPDCWSVLGGSDFAVDSENDIDDPGFAASMESLSLSTHPEIDDVATHTAPTSRIGNATRTESHHDDAGVEGRAGDLANWRARADQDRLHALYHRSVSSPSPTRRSSRHLPTARKLGAGRRRKAKNDNKGFAGAVGTNKGTFHDYLFA